MGIVNQVTGFFSTIPPSVQIIFIVLCVFVIRKLLKSRTSNIESENEGQSSLPPLKKRDFTVDELLEFDGLKNERVLLAVCGKVFDVSKGKSFYGPGGPYAVFGGHDASRGLATFSADSSAVMDVYDDLSDLNSMQLDSLREWEMQFMERYDHVGSLLKPGEKPQQYEESETEEEDDKKKYQ
ncbi:membrane-associated progesterone receptor component 2-like [Xenia sp. Carnegie-2017]|uniref:membrane-associated progesterone receptor component 2-like n=1 Tax=Xenia sp. Carnegie-2017 TaxID=2897299 RepID=UPI001F0399A6|nr:membrane-associated progesterone receptor component 2-like [Xenia sp. Carnegie-2017]